MKLRKSTILILIFSFIGFAEGQITKFNMDWYRTLNKSTLTPPDYIFSIVWGILYILLAVVADQVYETKNKQQFRHIYLLFNAQLALNWLWTPIFFGLHKIGISLLMIVAMVMLTLQVIYESHGKIDKVSYFLIPYLVWISFASYLTLVIFLNN